MNGLKDSLNLGEEPFQQAKVPVRHLDVGAANGIFSLAAHSHHSAEFEGLLFWI